MTAIQKRKKDAALIESLPQKTKDNIEKLLLSGRHPSLVDIAHRCGVTLSTINAVLRNDPDLAEAYENAMAITANAIENAAVDMCLDEQQHPIARQKMIEFMLPKLNPRRYGENSEVLNNAGRGIKRVAFVPVMPVVQVDDNGIPIVQSKSPLEQQAIDV